MINKLSIFSLLLVLITSCCKDKNARMDGCQKKEPTIYGPHYMGELADYAYFQPGTWWVYQNSVSKAYDTVSVLELARWMDTAYGVRVNQIIINEKFVVYQYGSALRENIRYYIANTSPDAIGPNAYQSRPTCAVSRGAESGSGRRILYPFVLGDSDGETTCVNTDTSMNINGTIYTGVKVFYVRNDGSSFIGFGSPNVYYYWAKNAGIVMKRIVSISPSEWHLIDKYIIQ